MRRLSVIVVPAVLTFLAGGCIVQSLHPFFTKDAVTTIPELEGIWKRLPQGDEPAPKHPWVFGDGTISTQDDRGGGGDLNVTYFKVGETTFLDATAGDSEPGGATRWWSVHVAPIHTLTQVVLEKDHLELRPLDFQWLKKAIQEKTADLSHVKYENSGDRLLFTATSEEWMAFLKVYGKDDKAFPDKDAIEFRRLVEPGARK